MNFGTIINGGLYVVIIGLMIASLVLGTGKIENYRDLVDNSAEVSMVMLMSSFYSVVIVFALFCVALLYMTRRKGMYSNDRDYHGYFLTFNAIILTLSLLMLFPTIAAESELGEDSYIISLLIGSSLALLVSFFNICLCLYHLPHPVNGGAPTLYVEQGKSMTNTAHTSGVPFVK